MAWRLAKSLVVLRDELNDRWPNRDKSSDGTIGDSAHRASASDHNENSQGDVCALDVDTDLDGTNDSNDPEMDALVEHVRLNPHPTLKYVIYRGRMFSSYAAHGFAPFEWRPYAGDSHVSHPHFSVGQGLDGRSAPGTYDDTSPWLATFETAAGGTQPQEDDLTPEQSKMLEDASAALGRLEVALGDKDNGLYPKVTALAARIEQIAKKVGA